MALESEPFIRVELWFCYASNNSEITKFFEWALAFVINNILNPRFHRELSRCFKRLFMAIEFEPPLRVELWYSNIRMRWTSWVRHYNNEFRGSVKSYFIKKIFDKVTRFYTGPSVGIYLIRKDKFWLNWLNLMHRNELQDNLDKLAWLLAFRVMCEYRVIARA